MIFTERTTEHPSTTWADIKWRNVEGNVRRLQERIYRATTNKAWKKVRNLQKLMLRSRSNALLAVRRVTQLNAGRLTAGVDGEVVVTVVQRAEMAHWLQHHAEPWSPQPSARLLVANPRLPLDNSGLHIS